jgi:hypothetical protein
VVADVLLWRLILLSAALMAWAWPEWWDDRFFVLIKTAKDLKDQGHPEAAIVTAQTACEVCTEIFLEAGFRDQDITYLKDPITKLLPNYNVANPRVRSIYETVCDDQIGREPFWARFKQHVERRNRIVHRGENASQQDAEDSIAVAEEVIVHIRSKAGYSGGAGTS